MKLRTRMLAGVAGSALIAGTMLFGSSPAGATTPGTYDWNTKCESVTLSLSIGTAIGVVGGGTGGASSTYTAAWVLRDVRAHGDAATSPAPRSCSCRTERNRTDCRK